MEGNSDCWIVTAETLAALFPHGRNQQPTLRFTQLNAVKRSIMFVFLTDRQICVRIHRLVLVVRLSLIRVLYVNGITRKKFYPALMMEAETDFETFDCNSIVTWVTVKEEY
jgi:hypothetical protein